MDNINDNQAITPESVLASVKEMFAISRVEFDRELKESRTEFDRKMEESRIKAEESRAEFDRKIEESRAEFDRKIEESRAEFDRKAKESRAEFDRKAEESRVEFDRELKESRAEFDRRSAELNKKLNEISEQVGGWGNSHGAFAEEYFFNSFARGQYNFFGEKFDEIKKNLKGAETDDEFDIVMFNGSSICIVEVKFRGRINKIPKLIKKAQAFRDNFPKYANHKIYLAIAVLVFEPGAEDECLEQGIAVVKQSGDNVIIHDERLKAY